MSRSRSTYRRSRRPSSATSRCCTPRRRDPYDEPTVSESILLTDVSPDSLNDAVRLLDGWEVKQVPADQLARAVGGGAENGVRAVLVESEDPTILRSTIERAHAANIPVVVACADDVARRRAVELKAEEWDR